jgi:SNF2 family DNA or RNA helicase
MSLSGATGITLTAASRLRVVEMDWSPSNMIQIEDRIWRIGQQKTCHIGYLFIPESLDVSIGNAIVKKMETDERTLNRPYFDLKMSPEANRPNPKISKSNQGELEI